MFAVPPFPSAPVQPVARGSCDLRFEDVAQDGRLDLCALPQSLDCVWADMFRHPELVAPMRTDGILPILSRMVAVGVPTSFPTITKLKVEGCFEMAHARGADGQVSRIFLNMWSRLRARPGRTWGLSEPIGEEEVPAGVVFAEHVMTRPFEPPERRKVLSLPLAGLEVPGAPYESIAPERLLELPEGVERLDAGLRADSCPTVFGLMHTDSNQHVNSLAYPRLFEEAVLRRLAELDRSTELLARGFDVVWRKPFFVGERARIVFQLGLTEEGLVAAGGFWSELNLGERPRCFMTMLLA